MHKPIIIIGAPRSGTTILFRCLALHPSIWHLRAESHYILEGPIHPSKLSHYSNRCTPNDVESETLCRLSKRFYQEAFNVNRLLDDPTWLFNEGGEIGRIVRAGLLQLMGNLVKYSKPDSIRFLEKTPKNSLRVALLNELFPNAYFIWNRRNPVDNIDSLVSGWHAEKSFGLFKIPRFSRSGYPVVDRLDLQGYNGKRWKFALVPGWRSLQSASIGEVAALQYYQCNRFSQSDFEDIETERVFKINHERFVERPSWYLNEILEWADLSGSTVVDQYARSLPKVNSVEGPEGDQSVDLRYPKEVRKGIRRHPELIDLAESIGYRSEKLNIRHN